MQLALSRATYMHPAAQYPILKTRDHCIPYKDGGGFWANTGCGKSTFSENRLLGLLKPDSGAVSGNLLAAYCPQEGDEAPTILADFALDGSPRGPQPPQYASVSPMTCPGAGTSSASASARNCRSPAALAATRCARSG